MKSIQSIRVALVLLPALAAPAAAAAQTARTLGDTAAAQIERPRAGAVAQPPRVHRSPATAVVTAPEGRAAVLGAGRPPGGACPPTHPCPPCEGAKRRLLSDGGVETRYTDGTVKVVRSDGGTLTTYADGTSVEEAHSGTTWRDKDGNVVSFRSKQFIFSQVTYATPPDPADSESTVARWLAKHDANLLAALRAALANEEGGPESLNRYLAREQEEGLGLYGQIAARTELLGRLLSP